MKNIITAMAALAAAFTMVSCEKEPIVETEAGVVGNDVITAYTEDNISKTTLSGNDTNGYDVVWSKGDKISIGGNIFELTEGEGTTKGTFKGALPQDGTYTAYYPATYDGSNWPENQKYVEGNITGAPMKAELTISGGQVTEPLSFKNVGGILRLTLKGNATVRDITFSGAANNISLTCGAGVQLNDTNGKVFHISLPSGEFPEAGFEFYFNDGNSINKRMKSGTKLIIERSKITKASISGINSTGPIDMLPGVFKVSDNRKVRFSKGNLRYTVASKTWSFFDEQYNCGPKHYEDGHDKEISLFTWGYNSTKSIIPDGNNWDNVSRRSGDLERTEDWGCTIGDGYTWRTLTNDEWQYMLKTRPDAKKKYGLATVCGNQGLIILPDTFIDPMTNGGSGEFHPYVSTSWTINVYTDEDWEAMEYAGAVFLPSAGLREDKNIWPAAHYWSASVYPDQYSSNAHIIYFNQYAFFNDDNKNRGFGCSVRLVTDTDASYTYSVTFDPNGKAASGIPASIRNLEYGTIIARPTDDPVAEGYLFTGWYKDRKCTDLWDFDSDAVTKHTTLYAGWAEAPLSGKYTVNSSGKQVYFSKGNLWADSSNNLHFEDKQYSFNSKYEAGHVSHFTWSSTLNVAKGTSGSGTNLFCDEAHKVSVGISGPLYYTLSKDEWEYLFTGRTDGVGGYDIDITYGGVKGILIYPDGYDSRYKKRPGTVIESDADFPKGGVVFLPAAGWRDGETVRTNDITKRCYGYYWSASSTSDLKPYSLNFFCGGGAIELGGTDGIVNLSNPNEEETHGAIYISEPGYRNNALSIRLVIDVN